MVQPTRFAPPPPMQVASSGQSICLGKQQVTERLEPDRAAVEAADDAVDRSPLPDRHGVHASMGRQPLRSGVQVVAGVRVASDDGAKVACSLRAQTHWVDQLERAVRRLEHVEVVYVAVDEHGLSVVVGAAATLSARQSILDGRSGTRLTRLLPQPRKQLGILARLVRACRKVNIGADRTPEPDSDLAQHVMSRTGIRHDVVQGSAESLEQDRATLEIDAQQARAAGGLSDRERSRSTWTPPPIGWQVAGAGDVAVAFKVMDRHFADALGDEFAMLASPTCSQVQLDDLSLTVTANEQVKPLVQQGRSFGIRIHASSSWADVSVWQGGNLVMWTNSHEDPSASPQATPTASVLNQVLAELGLT